MTAAYAASITSSGLVHSATREPFSVPELLTTTSVAIMSGVEHRTASDVKQGHGPTPDFVPRRANGVDKPLAWITLDGEACDAIQRHSS